MLLCALGALGCEDKTPAGPAPSRFAAVKSQRADSALGSFCEQTYPGSGAGSRKFVAAPNREVPGLKTAAGKTGTWQWLNLWATWCPPCLMEMPSLERLWKRFEAGGKVQVLCLSEEKVEDVRAHRIASMAMPLYVFTSPVPEELQAEGLPTTYIFDQEGRVLFGHTGMAKWDDPEIVAYLEALAEGKN